MKKKKRPTSVFSDLIDFVISGSLTIVLGTLLLVIYLPFSKSIQKAFQPDPAPIESVGGQYSATPDEDRVVDGIHVATGMIYDKNFQIVKNACTSCHSAKLVTQNKATRDGWKQMIRWMQATQGLPDLGKNEAKILDYLAKNYAPQEFGRRANLNPEEIEWYDLNLQN